MIVIEESVFPPGDLWQHIVGPLFAQCLGAKCEELKECWMPFRTAPVGEINLPDKWKLEVLEPAGGDIMEV